MEFYEILQNRKKNIENLRNGKESNEILKHITKS